MNNKGTEQPVHPRRLISAFVIHFLKSIISKLASSEISIFYLVSVAEQAGLKKPRRQVLSGRGPSSGPPLRLCLHYRVIFTCFIVVC